MADNRTLKMTGGNFKYYTVYSVTGHGSLFGVLDMMRRDRSSPNTSEDSTKIANIQNKPLEDQTIQMIAYHEVKKWSPLVGRWESFGYEVELG